MYKVSLKAVVSLQAGVQNTDETSNVFILSIKKPFGW